jgi:hypothetical protein
VANSSYERDMNDGVLWPEPTEAQRKRSTDFCRHMHFYCRSDGLSACPVCRQRLFFEPSVVLGLERAE